MADTIAAIATAASLSAIGIIRMSGDDAIAIAGAVFSPKNGRLLAGAVSRKMIYGTLNGRDGEPIDLALAVISRAPDSYTGEDTAEFHCHGSPTVLGEGLAALYAAGARPAAPGEFTKRAFLNGKLDLAQAEAVVDLINSETAEAAKNAAGQLDGAISRRANAIYGELVDIIAHFQAAVDYPDEDIAPFELEKAQSVIQSAAEALESLVASFDRGRILRDGVKSAIVGRPNAGKSSLLNALLGYDRAIVTPIAGTTRDTIEESVKLGGVLLRLSDTAGIRKTVDPIEHLGVSRAIAAAKGAQLVFVVLDGSEELGDEDRDAINAAAAAPMSVAVVNKADLEQKIDTDAIRAKFTNICFVSALDHTGIEKLDALVRSIFETAVPTPRGEILTNARQADAAARALSSLRLLLGAIENGITPDAVLTDLEDSLSALGEITGKTVRDDVLLRIFERFCVGK